VTDTVVHRFTIRLLLSGGKAIDIHGPANLTEETTDAIVNAANSSLLGGGGVDGAIHRAGGRDGERGEAETLASCHRESIRLADEHALSSLSFPAVSTGAYGYPVTEAAPIALSATLESLATAKHVTLCRFVLFDVSTVRAFQRAAETLHRTTRTSPFRIEKAHS
jgi:O-acetyl-ADP-ribose deacetylase (regulator of RNase III)